MKVLVTKDINKANTTIVIPLLKNEQLGEALQKIAEEYQIPANYLKAEFKGDAKEKFSAFVQQDATLWLLGLGDKLNAHEVIATFRHLGIQIKSKIRENTTIDFRFVNFHNYFDEAIIGIAQSTYRLGLYKTDPNGIHPLSKGTLSIVLPENAGKQQADAERALAIAETQCSIMDLVNAAPENKTPQYLAEWTEKSAEKYNYKVTIFDKKRCKKEGLEALLSVNKGSRHEPRFIIAEYAPKNATKTIGLVGKGVTFDTGGISIKPSTNMHLMKSDMGGAAAVLGAVELAARLGLPVRVVGIVPSTENMVDGKGTKPGDVVGSYLGKTIEVIDTDAEGRIILADGLAYMKKEFKPDCIIDLATLTGNIIAALGNQAAGLFSNNDVLAQKLTDSGNKTGEKLWRMPIWEAYAEDLKSDVADLANYSGKPFAGAISAAKFLEVFVDGHTEWAHLDIAGMALANNELGMQRAATAFGVRLLVDFMKNY